METPPYQVSQSADGTNQIRQLYKTSVRLGLKNEFLAALKTIADKPQNIPTQWGEPLYHPKREGTCVYHAARNPLFVRYVVFEPEKKVVILQVAPVPMSDLQ